MNNNVRIDTSILPEIAFITLCEDHFENDRSWKGMIDVVADHGTFNLIALSMRIKGHAVAESDTKELVRKFIDYAQSKGIGVAFDLDPRLARKEFQRRHPDEMQKVIRLEEIVLQDGCGDFEIRSFSCHDHMTGQGTPYYPLEGKFVRAFAGNKNKSAEIIPDTLTDVSRQINIDKEDAGIVTGSLELSGSDGLTHLFVMAEFSLFSPDVFSPHIIDYQRELLEQYHDLPLKGAVKDEWGFPTTQGEMFQRRAFWYSEFYDREYAGESGGGCLLDDLLVMAIPFEGRDERRVSAIRIYMDLNFRRNIEIEQHYYDDVKAVFGRDAIVAKHPTWYPRINEHEIFKNGISWWGARRDWAQTDEITPLSACTALCKKFNSPNWLNEGYSNRVEHYERNIWRYALGGGRMVFHPLYPDPFANMETGLSVSRKKVLRYGLYLNSDLIQAQCRVRLLNFISKSPLDCPVAFVFGHESLMNWAGDGYLDYGEELSLELWRNGYAVDLYPSSEISAGTFEITDDGYVKVGPQRYSALVLYHPELCPKSVCDFFNRNPITETTLYRVGNWTKDSSVKAFDGNNELPPQFIELQNQNQNALDEILSGLSASNAPRQTPLTEEFLLFESEQIGIPAPDGTSRLIDGTVIRILANRSYAGDPIDEIIAVNGVPIRAKAQGLFAARVDAAGKLQAIAAGGLSLVQGAGVSLDLHTPLDVALWRDEKGKWKGVAQGIAESGLPRCLKQLCNDWTFLDFPTPFKIQGSDYPLPEV